MLGSSRRVMAEHRSKRVVTCSPEVMPLVSLLVIWRRVMRRSRFTEEQIIGVLREHDGGVKTADLCCRHGISDATFYNWKAKYDGLTVSDAARRRAQPDVDADMAALARMALRTTLSDNRRFRAIAFIGLPPACSRRTRTTVSTTNIPISPPEKPSRCLNHRNAGSLLDTDHPAKAVPSARRSTPRAARYARHAYGPPCSPRCAAAPSHGDSHSVRTAWPAQ